MLSKEEQQKCGELLKRVEIDDIFSLAKTVSGGVVMVQTKPDAIDAILKFTDTSAQLLGRKKVKRNILIQYLVDNGVTGCVNEEKTKLINRILTLWGLHGPLARLDDEYGDIDDYGADIDFTPPAPVQQMQDTVPNLTINIQHIQQNPIQNVQNEPLPLEVDIGQQIAEQFVQWFYPILNSLHPHAPVAATDFGPQHFWDDCILKLKCQTNDFFEERFESAYMVFQRLAAFVREEGLLFHPNTVGNGVKGFSEAHGLTVVMVCGSVHQDNICVGLFEQRFGLIQDPLMENNYRVKYTDLNLRSPTLNAGGQYLTAGQEDPLSLTPAPSQNVLVNFQ
ncbi:uncharacterized protein C3orf38 homolog [Lineus longissimus]|uniref:uncharacterized protein C3orf38 homolog n=1 Tax=Lineus longissimus TaxID=88925 RepID=UPI002B4C2E8E